MSSPPHPLSLCTLFLCVFQPEVVFVWTVEMWFRLAAKQLRSSISLTSFFLSVSLILFPSPILDSRRGRNLLSTHLVQRTGKEAPSGRNYFGTRWSGTKGLHPLSCIYMCLRDFFFLFIFIHPPPPLFHHSLAFRKRTRPSWSHPTAFSFTNSLKKEKEDEKKKEKKKTSTKQDPSTSPTAFENGYYFDLEVAPSNDSVEIFPFRSKWNRKTTTRKAVKE